MADITSDRREFGHRCASWTVGHFHGPKLTFDDHLSLNSSCLGRYILIDCGTRCSEVAVAELTVVDRRTGALNCSELKLCMCAFCLVINSMRSIPGHLITPAGAVMDPIKIGGTTSPFPTATLPSHNSAESAIDGDAGNLKGVSFCCCTCHSD